MKSLLGIISTLVLLTGLGVCASFLVASTLGKVTPADLWDVVAMVGLPLAAAGAVGVVLTGHLRAELVRLGLVSA